MANVTEKSLEKILQKPSHLATLLEHVKYLAKLNQIFWTQFPHLANHCQIANLRDAKLIIEVNNNAWATRIHYQTTEIITQLNKLPEFSAVQHLNYFVKKSFFINNKNRKPATISTENKKLVKEIAEYIANPLLKKALLRIGD